MNPLVLIINDDPQQAQHFAHALLSEGMSALIATDEQQGIKLARTTRPAVILLDAMMALDSQRYHIAHQLCDSAETASTPLILTRGLTHPPGFRFDQEARAAGLRVAALISNAATAPQIVATIKQIIGDVR
jgi:CheY-like chemotaxis protein